MKPCPFCGSRARVQAYKRLYGPHWARVICTNRACAARGPTVRRVTCCGPEEVPATRLVTFQELKDWAENAWNGRAE